MPGFTRHALAVAMGVGFLLFAPCAARARSPSTQPAATPTETVLTADVSGPHAHMGHAIALDGDWIMAGASGADHDGTYYVGAVYAFQFANGAWIQREKLSPRDGRAGEKFGSSVALDGDTLAVGAPGWGADRTRDTGAVYLFTRTATGWTQTAKLTPPAAPQIAWFGAQVALHGDTLAVAAPRLPWQHFAGVGAVFVYHRDASEWRLLATLVPPTPAPSCSFGAALALDRDLLLVKDTAFPERIGDETGIVQVFRLVDGQWSLTGALKPPDKMNEPYFGRSIAVCGARVLVGASIGGLWSACPAGDAYLFECDSGMWRLAQKLRPADSGPGDGFGCAVALNQDRAAISALSSIYAAPMGGRQALYVFERRNDEWGETARFAGTDLDAAFGASVALNDRWIAGGAPGSLQGKHPGAVHVIDRAPKFNAQPQRRALTVSTQSTFRPRDPVEDHSLYFGRAAALHSDLAVITAPRLFGRGTSGSAWVVERVGEQWRESCTLKPEQGDRVGSFGISAATDGQRIVVGVEPECFPSAPQNREPGGAYVYERCDGAWSTSQRLRVPGPDAGCAVAIDGDVILIADDGRPREGNRGAATRGVVFVYERSGEQ